MLSVNSARPPVGIDSRSMTFFSELERDAAALTDHVERHVARLQAPLDVVDRRVAALVLAVGEHDERLASGLAAEHVDAAQDARRRARSTPHGASRSTALMRSAGSVALRVSVKMLSLNPSSVT